MLDASTSGPICRLENNGGTPRGLYLNFTGASPDNNSQYYLYCNDTTTDRMFIWSDGDCMNHDGTYGTISDERIKQDITDLASCYSRCQIRYSS